MRLDGEKLKVFVEPLEKTKEKAPLGGVVWWRHKRRKSVCNPTPCLSQQSRIKTPLHLVINTI